MRMAILNFFEKSFMQCVIMAMQCQIVLEVLITNQICTVLYVDNMFLRRQCLD